MSTSRQKIEGAVNNLIDAFGLEYPKEVVEHAIDLLTKQAEENIKEGKVVPLDTRGNALLTFLKKAMEGK